MKLFCLNKVSPVALQSIKKPDSIVEDIYNADAILVRSQSMNDINLDNNILAVARAGTGINNIPVSKLSEKGIVVFNTPGANSNSVKELVLCSLFLASRDIIGGSEWVKTNKDNVDIEHIVEKAKNQFSGQEVLNKTIAIIGLGSIGVMVANSCVSLGMKVRGYDPYVNRNNLAKLSHNVGVISNLEDTIKNADFVSLHVPLNESTNGMFNNKVFDYFKGTVLLNFSRGALVNDDDLLMALSKGKVTKYVTDFANPKVVNMPNTLVLPHLGASTQEAEDNCTFMAIDELKNFLENGVINHSVNFPDVDCGPKECKLRACILHKNVPGIINKITSVISSSNNNIVKFVNKSKGEYAYSVFDIDGEPDIQKVAKIECVLRVRVI